MNKRPLSVTLVSCLFVATGTIGIIYHLSDFAAQRGFRYDVWVILLVRLMAVVSGIYMLRAGNWARWLALIWLAFHVVLSAFHSLSEAAIHSVLLIIVAYLLLRPPASEYFRSLHQD